MPTCARICQSVRQKTFVMNLCVFREKIKSDSEKQQLNALSCDVNEGAATSVNVEKFLQFMLGPTPAWMQM